MRNNVISFQKWLRWVLSILGLPVALIFLMRSLTFNCGHACAFPFVLKLAYDPDANRYKFQIQYNQVGKTS